jgi:prolyl-tRNA synthetase
MNKKIKTAISPTREEDYSEWYQQVVKGADLAEHSVIRGCMIIKPWGYGLWENIQAVLDGMIKKTGHKNVYFPLFIPLSFFQKEAQHVEGFAKECAVVTHHRLTKNKEGKLVPDGELEEPLIVRPTSEMIIGEAFAKWVESYRDLPLLINQWANIVRWEMRTRLFLRTTEFLWQEGHTAHSTKEEAIEETLKMLEVYSDFSHRYLAMPVIKGEKSEAERFPGADNTYCIETMMQDRKSLQAGTSHFLGQNFAKASDIKFTDRDGQIAHAWTTSWGVTTRLIGGLVMTHGDDDGFILPPRIAPSHIAIIPIIHSEDVRGQVLDYCHKLKNELEKISYFEKPLKVILDDRDMRGGDKKWEWIKKGVPLRIEVGPRDIENDQLCVFRRDFVSQVIQLKRIALLADVPKILDEIQNELLHRATNFRENNTVKITNKKDFYDFFTPKNPDKPEIHGGYALCNFSLDIKEEEKLKEELGVTVRCIPFNEKEDGKCIFTNKSNARKVIFAKAY